MENTEVLRDWFQRSGVHVPLNTCIGPLPNSGASIVRWKSEAPDAQVLTARPLMSDYRIAVMMEPLDACIWNDERPVWGGLIAADRFRICPPGVASQSIHMSGCDIVNLFLPVEFVEHLNDQRQTSVPLKLGSTSYISDHYVMNSIHHMLDAKVMAGPLYQQYCDALMVVLVCYLLEHYSARDVSYVGGSLIGTRLRKVLHYLEGNLAEEINISFLAAMCGQSRSHFSREFHRALGLPPHRYLLNLRLEKARNALLEEKASVVDIAYAYGFHDSSHLSHAFTKLYGVSPVAYRQRYRVLPT